MYAKSLAAAAADQVEAPAAAARDLAGSNLFSALLELDVRVSLRPVERPCPAGAAAPEWVYTITDPDGGPLLTDVTRAVLEEWTRQHATSSGKGRSLDRLYAAFEIREAVGLLQDLLVALLAAQRAGPDDRAHLTGIPLEEWIRRALDQHAMPSGRSLDRLYAAFEIREAVGLLQDLLVALLAAHRAAPDGGPLRTGLPLEEWVRRALERPAPARCGSVAPRCGSVALTLGELVAQIRQLETKHGRGILASELVAPAGGGQTGHVLGLRPSPVGGSIVVELETDIGAVAREAPP